VSEKEEREKDQRLLDLFEGAKGRRPETDQELGEWLASPEGKAATAIFGELLTDLDCIL
jgi:hypothetical protein